MSHPQPPSSRSQRHRELKQSVSTRQELWGWGTEEGLIPWGDRSGSTTIALWQSESRAREENEGPDAEPDEVPVRFTVTELQAKVPTWTRKGVRRYGLEPKGEDTLYSLHPEEFLTFIGSELAVTRRLP